MTGVLPDAPARARISTDLDTNLLVEAGAGSGKTTALVDRMVALVRDRGIEVERIAAVTFTRKAAGELRERFQGKLEEARAEAEPGTDARARLDGALGSVDRAFMGTIHAFCARLLRERPLEAGLDPAFGELTAPQANLLARRWWSVWLERLAADGEPVLGELQAVGIQPGQLFEMFRELTEHSDVDFPTPPSPRPDPSEIQAVRGELERLMAEAETIFPGEEPAKGWDGLQSALRTAWFMRRTLDWSDDRVFLEAVDVVWSKARGGSAGVTLYKWIPDKKAQGPIKDLRDAFQDWGQDGSRTERLIQRWMAHRYPIALGFARRAAAEFAEHRRRTGQLSFHDLLVLATELLRRSAAARQDLGTRYRHVLVDEFQDTDPLQAELLFLLAGDPTDDGTPGDWRTARPRVGALFVVGDPKQSIYRFRRADIALYQQVRRRFDPGEGGFGEVLRLTSNFRSRPPVAELVNAVFDDPLRFPRQPSMHQAAFAPMEPQRDGAHVREGVYLADVDPAADDTGLEAEARALAAWIAARVAPGGDREAGDFLVLTRKKKGLEAYARALEAHDLPVEVSGAGVGIEEEMAELRYLLRALSDPDDAVLTLTALTGLFFGLDLELLLQHREAVAQRDDRHVDGAFDFRQWPAVEEGDYRAAALTAPVEAALGTMHRWWLRARHTPADVVVAELVDELGLMAHAAAGDLGQIRAGALAFALDAMRGAGLEGDTSLVGALEALETALSEEEAEAPLQPGREQAVRLMNVHKAKGLEADVVVLANPWFGIGGDITLLVERTPGGEVAGWARVGEPRKWGGVNELARPRDWDDKQAAEQVFQDAEEVRLLYVAATRAGQELVVMRPADPKKAAGSPWSLFHPWLEAHASPLALAADPPPARERLAVGADDIATRVDFVAARRQASAEGSYGFDTVTALVRSGDAGQKPEAPEAPPVEAISLEYALSEADATGPGGFEWGSAVHAVLEAAMQGVEGEALEATARAALVENDRPMREGEPTELETLLGLVEAVRRSPLWERARQAELLLAEHPFVLEQDDGRYLEGVIDLAFREAGRWVVVDYKTDRRDGPEAGARNARYRAQVERYGQALAALTGEPVVETRLWFLRGGRLRPDEETG